MRSIIIDEDEKLIVQGEKIFIQTKHKVIEKKLSEVSDIHWKGSGQIDTKTIYSLLRRGIIIYFHEPYGKFIGSALPLPYFSYSGKILLKQSEYFNSNEKRFSLAQEIEEGIKHNTLWLLQKYKDFSYSITDQIQAIKAINFKDVSDINQLKIKEAHMATHFYQAVARLFFWWKFNKRTRQPPKDPISALISYENIIHYSKLITEAYRTFLHPGIGYIHEPEANKTSLAYDIADIFKPVVVYQTIFHTLSFFLLKGSHFLKKGEAVLLNAQGKRIYRKLLIRRFDYRIKDPQTHFSHTLSTYLTRELYKLRKHLTNNSPYKSFKAWW